MKKYHLILPIILILFSLVTMGVIGQSGYSKLVFLTRNKLQGLSFSQKSQNESISLILAGDMMFDRYIRQVAQNHGYDYILSGVKDKLLSSDLVIANLEGPITQSSSISIGSQFGSPANYVFTFDPQLSSILANHNIFLVNIGNNHILNFGKSGLSQTKEYLEASQVNFFGFTGQDQDQVSTIVSFGNFRIGLINYNQFTSASLTATLSEIKQLQEQVEITIVYAHWGDEYQPVAKTNIQALAHQFIAQGADLVVGSHPHVVQQSEIYQDKHIYYSLGNFVFDQYFSDQTQQGLLLEVRINPFDKSIEVREIPVSLKKTGQTILAE